MPLVIGQIIHRIARGRLMQAIRGQRLETAREMRSRITDELNAIYLASKSRRQAFLANPSRVPMLAEVFWGEGVSDGTAARARRTIAACAESLEASPIFVAVRGLPADAILAVDSLTAFDVDGVTVYGAPDLVFRDGDLWDGKPLYHVLDWKTGTATGAIDQVATYACLVSGAWTLDPHDVTIMGEVVPLGESGDPDAFTLTPDDLASAVDRIRVGVSAMQGYCEDVAANRPKPIEAFPARVGPHCSGCGFRGICPEARDAGVVRGHRMPAAPVVPPIRFVSGQSSNLSDTASAGASSGPSLDLRVEGAPTGGLIVGAEGARE